MHRSILAIIRALALASVILFVHQRPVAAQDSTAERTSAFGVLVGVPGVGSTAIPELASIGISWTQLQPGSIGADFALGTAPRLLALQAVALGARGDFTVPIRIGSSVRLLPAAGVSVVGIGAGNFAGGFLGFNAGLSALAGASGPIGFRFGLTMHDFPGAVSAAWLFECGIVWLH